MLKRTAQFVSSDFYDFLTKLPWVVAIAVVAAILVQGLTEHVTVIQSLSVPKTLADGGYTAEVAGYRLRDALSEFVRSINTHMKSPEIALQGELPNIVVPTVGISLDAVMSSIRTLLRSTRSRTITGEFTILHDQLSLRLRLDGRDFYTADGGDPNNPDEMLKNAVPALLKEIRPYLVAASLSDKNPDEALAAAEDIIARLPESDENVAWAYSLKGSLFEHRKEYSPATEALRKAIQLNGQLVVAHVNLGVILVDQGHLQQGIDEYHKALDIEKNYSLAHNDLGIALHRIHQDDRAMAELQEAIKDDPNSALPYVSIGNILHDSGDNDGAIMDFQKAIKINPHYAVAHNNLGNALRSAGKTDEAIAEFKESIKQDPKYALPHRNLGAALHAAGKDDEAIAEYNETIELDPQDAAAHNNLGVSLRALGKYDEAIAEYRAAIGINPNYILAHNNLGFALHDISKNDDAIAEFRAVLIIDPNNSTALDELKKLGVDAKHEQ